MSYLLKNGEQAFTLVQLLVGLAVSLIVIGVTLKMFIVQQKVFRKQEQLSEMHQNVRAAMDIIMRETRMGGYDPTGAGIDGITYDATQLQIKSDIDGDGAVTSTNEDIIYTYDSGNLQIDREDVNVGSGAQVVAENIQTFTFSYLNADGVGTTTSTEIRQVDIQITGRTSNIDSDIGDYRYSTLTSVITPTNLGL